MATSDEIRERIEQADAARNIRRLAAAQRVGELASRRKKLTTEVDEIDAELGAVVAENVDVISPQELAAFTDVPASDLTDWLNRRKTARTKRRRTTKTELDTKNETPQAQALMPPVTVEPHGALPRIPEPVT